MIGCTHQLNFQWFHLQIRKTSFIHSSSMTPPFSHLVYKKKKKKWGRGKRNTVALFSCDVWEVLLARKVQAGNRLIPLWESYLLSSFYLLVNSTACVFIILFKSTLYNLPSRFQLTRTKITSGHAWQKLHCCNITYGFQKFFLHTFYTSFKLVPTKVRN